MKKISFACGAATAMIVAVAPALSQYTGTSHPDEVPISTSNEGISQPVVFVPASAAPAPAGGALAVAQPAPPLPARAVAAVPLQPAVASDADAGVVVRVPGPANMLPEGTLIKTRLLQDVSTRSTPEGTEWSAELLEPLTRDGQVLIPAGALLKGRVTEIHGGKRISGEASIHLQTLAVVLPDGTTRGLHAQVIDTGLSDTVRVDNEGTILRRNRRKEEGGILALTMGSGAAAGALIAGVPGALVGAGVGGGVSAALWLKQDRQADLPKDAQVTFELTRSMTIGQE
jgi:hypothetical protein